MREITFLPSNIKVTAKSGEKLLDVITKTNINIDASCGGNGRCGKCKVKIASEEGYKLACQLTIKEDMEILIPTQKAKISSKKMLSLPNFKADKTIKKYYMELKTPSLKEILNNLPKERFTIEPSLLIHLSEFQEQEKWPITVVAKDNHIIGIEAGNTINSSYGLALDIGTTTVAGMLWDLNKGGLVGANAKTNPQKVYGADVISRINYCDGKRENIDKLKVKIRECINEIIKDLIIDLKEKYNINSKNIYDVTVVGNTTMSHLFLGASPKQLGVAPFIPVFTEPIDVRAKDIGIEVNQYGNVHLLGNIAGHVGSDITALLITTKIMEKEGLNIAIDIGTNGEIIISKNGFAVTASTAAGPAFEGASIHNGMRAASGAIEGVQIKDGEVNLDIIDNISPVGICGSGLIDLVAQLLDVGIIDPLGKLIDEKTAANRGVHKSLIKRLGKGQNGREFVLANKPDREDIIITQKDIREIQLAKGAIHGGIATILKSIGSKPEEIDNITIAGAFGNHIKKESALRIGLFPRIPLDKIILGGNTAGAGASMALMSSEERNKAYIASKKVKHIELANSKDFNDEFINHLNFPK